MPDGRWRLWIDTGGTFTDCLAVNPAGELRRAKVLSSAALRARVAAVDGPRAIRLDEGWGLPDGFFVGARFRVLGGAGGGVEVAGYGAAEHRVELVAAPGSVLEVGRRCELTVAAEAPVLAAHVVTQTPLGDELPPMAMRLATTRATNALLERRGAPTVLFTTRGFADLELIGTQQRPDLFALDIRKPAPLYESVVELAERVDAAGRVLEELRPEELRPDAEAALARGVRSAAVVLLHAWRNPDHERALAAALRAWGFDHVSCSAELAPMIGALPRSETAVVDAYLAPVISDYVADVARAVSDGTLHVMTSRRRTGRAPRACAPRTRSCPDRRGGWWARRRRPTARAFAAPSASTWAAPAPTWRATTAATTTSSSTGWGTPGCWRRPWAWRRWRPAAARSAPSAARGCRWGRKARARARGRPATAPAAP